MSAGPICPTCEAQGLEPDRVDQPQGSFVTLMMGDSYWSHGQFHSHDPNWATSEYRCSNGHRWRVRSQGKCGACDFGGGYEVTEL